MHEPITVLLIDDHVLVREGVREILETQPDLLVVGEAGDSQTGIELAVQRRPRVVLLDVEIPGGDVTDTVTKLRHLVPETRIIILSMYDGPHLVQRLLSLGICGYLLKSVSRAELVSAIRQACVDNGNVTLSVSRHSLTQPLPGADPLSPRETDVLKLAAQAMTNAQIAARLFLTEATIKRHLSNVFAKLGAVSRIDAVNKAVAAGLIPPQDGVAPIAPPEARAANSGADPPSRRDLDPRVVAEDEPVPPRGGLTASHLGGAPDH